MAEAAPRLEHLAIYTDDLERLRAFYERYFSAQAGPLYANPTSGFRSYFLRFGAGARLEIMHKPGIPAGGAPPGAEQIGLAHLAISVGSAAAVDTLTARLRSDGYQVASNPRRTGDGYYESVILDPDGNRVEITA